MKKRSKQFLWGAGIFVVAVLLGLVSTDTPLVGGLAGFVQDTAGSLGGAGAFSVSGKADTSSQAKPSGQQLVTDSLIVQMNEMYSDSPTNANGGTLQLYDKGVNPSNPSATTRASITIGTAYTGADVLCGRTYRVVYDNSTEAYAIDMGDQVLIDCDLEYNKETADSFVDLTAKFGAQRQEVAGLTDIMDEAGATTRINNQNGSNSTQLDIGFEIGCVEATGCSADSALVYDESQGDGTIFLDLVFEASGSDSALKDAVVCFEHESGAEPEGNEITDIVVSHRTGDTLDFPTGTNWESVWANEECVKASSEYTAGSSAEYRFTITYSEANLDANDDFTIVFDDLNDNRGKDATLNAGATRDTVDLDARA